MFIYFFKSDLYELKLYEAFQVAPSSIQEFALKKGENYYYYYKSNTSQAKAPTNRHMKLLTIYKCYTKIFTVGRSKRFTIVPLGSATIISTGKLYFSRCNRAFSLNAWFCSSAYL